MLEAFGDKIKARHVALAAGTRPVPGTDGPIAIDTPEGVEAAKGRGAPIGYPILVKAAGGGGGIGMQIVPAKTASSARSRRCSDRGKAAFADARVYLERYVDQPRHIEVQVFCDALGGAYALGERECSVQRRHQKIVEESPSPAAFFAGEAGEARRRDLYEAALRVVKQVGYRGAGTCEFVADASGELFFLEVNARLQVEHPVTELVTGLDLVELQLRVAAGEPLPELSRVTRRGHAIEARVYAEDPSKGFIPKPGPIDELVWAGGAGESQTPPLRIESGVSAGSKVTPFYDPMIAKVAAWGETRAAAIDELARALAGTTGRAVHDEPRVPAQGARGAPSSARAPTTRASPRPSSSAREPPPSRSGKGKPPGPRERESEKRRGRRGKRRTQRFWAERRRERRRRAGTRRAPGQPVAPFRRFLERPHPQSLRPLRPLRFSGLRGQRPGASRSM